MEVVIYVEGKSDKLAMEAVLNSLIEEKEEQGIAIKFFETPSGHRKKSVLEKVPEKAVDILRNKPNSLVVALPDLYPPDSGFPHTTFTELEEGILKRFYAALKYKGIEDTRIKDRFKVFCFKYDLESLVLAAESELKNRLKVDTFSVKWTKPVEDQNHDNPPKRIVSKLFQDAGKIYKETIDVPIILGNASYQEIAERCSQCFKPFVEFLKNL